MPPACFSPLSTIVFCDGLGTNREVGQCREADVDVHHGRRLAEKGHLLHPVDRRQARLDPLRPFAQLRRRKPGIGRQAVIDAVDVAEVVGHGHRRGTRRQAGLDVEHLAAQLVPQLRNLAGRGRRIEFDHDFRESVAGLRRDLMHAAHRLHLAFDGFGNERFDFERRSAREVADQGRTLDDENRILLLAQGRETGDTAGEQDKKEEADDLGVAERIFGQIHGLITL